MNRYAAFALAIVALGVLGFILYPHLKTSQEPIPAPNIPEQTTVTTQVIAEDADTYTIDVKYPQFGIPAIDTDIRAKVDAAVSEFRELPPNPPESATPKNEFTGTFEVVYIGPGAISAKLILSQYTGGAHPMTIVSGINYDTATGEPLTREDAFRLIGKTVQQVSAEATAQLEAKVGDAFFEEGASPDPENFSSFVVSEDEVTFIFQQYQVAPYALGVQEISFDRVEQ